MTELETLSAELEALRAELHELKDAHEALRARFERFVYVPPELVSDLVRGSREMAEWQREREMRQP